MKSQSEFNDILHCFFIDIGVPVSLVMDGYMAQKNNKTKKLFHQVGMTLRILEVGTPWVNHAELNTKHFKEADRKDPCVTNMPMVLCDYCIERQAQIHNAVPRPIFQNQDMKPHETTVGKQGNISNIYVTLGGTIGYTI